MMKCLESFKSKSKVDFEKDQLVDKQSLLDQGLSGEEIIEFFDDGYDKLESEPGS